MMQLLTNSRAKEARACLKLHHLRYELGYRSVHEAAALRFGTLWHKGLEGWWPGGTPEVRLEAALKAVELAVTPETDAFERMKVEELLRGYTARWGDENYETLAVEVEFRVPMLNPETGAASRTWEQAGKIDLVVRERATGRVLIGEHKSSSEPIEPGSFYWKRLKIDGQVSTYYTGAAALGYDVEGCLYDVVKKPALRPLKATPVEARKYTKIGVLYANQREVDETVDEYRARLREDIAAKPDEYFQRAEVVRLEEEMRDHAFDTWALGRLVREAEIAKRWPRNPQSCLQYGRECVFFPHCIGEASLDDTTMYQQSDNVHPELTGSDVAKRG